MKLTLHGHDDRYAIEQLQMSLFAQREDGEAFCALHRGKTWLTAVTTVTLNGKTTRASRRMKAAEETVPLRRRILQQSVYLAALPHLEQIPAWGALAGVRPTKLSTRSLKAGKTAKEAEKELRQVYFVTPQRAKLAVDCSLSTVKAANLL